MTAWITVIGALLRLVFLFAETWNTKSKEEKAYKENIIKEAQDAIANGDTSSLTVIFSKLR